MKRLLTLAALAACLSVPTATADDCCTNGQANPWKGYNKGIRWIVGLSREPARWKDLSEEDVTVTPGSSLASRQALFGKAPGAGRNGDWKRGLQPALDRARRENKPVLFFQLVGDLDLEGC